jgi:tyrosine-protein kinase Etk/Wzc
MDNSFEPNNIETQNVQAQFDASDLIIIFKRSWIWILIFIALGLLGAYSFVRWSQPKYNASSVLKLEMKKQIGLSGMGGTFEKSDDNYNDLSGEIEFIKSNLIYDDVIKKLNLNVEYYQEGQFRDEEKFGNSPFLIQYDEKTIAGVLDRKIYIKYVSKDVIKYGLQNLDNSKVEYIETRINQANSLDGFIFSIKNNYEFNAELVDVPFYVILKSYPSLQNYFATNLSVNVLNISAKTIQIGFTDINASKAAAIVNAIDTVYLNKTISSKQLAQEQTLDFIHAQLDSAENKLSSAENSIENFVRNVKTNDPSSEFASTLIKIDELREVVKLLDRQMFHISDIKKNIDFDAPMENALSVYSGLENQQLKSGILELNEKFNQLERLKLTYNESTMAYKKQKAVSDNLKSSLRDMINQEYSSLNKEKTKVIQEMSDLQARFYSLPSKETELNRLKRFYNLYEKYYLSLQQKEVEYGIAKAGTVPEFVILAKAYVNNNPISPVRKMVYGIGFFIGVVLSLILLVLKYLLQNKIISENELKSKIKVAFLGSVPKYILNSMEFSQIVISENPKSSISESFRSIRTNIEFMCSLNQKRIIGVTSTTSGEGKTFVTVNLASIIAASGKKVIVIDLDMRKPKVHHCFNANNEIGISNFLAGRNDLKECIHYSEKNKIAYITAGTIPPNPSELMLTERFELMLEQLKEEFDIVFVDTPPIGIVTDANIAMKKADLSIFVLRSEYTLKGSEQIVNSMYQNRQFKQIGVILNSVDQSLNYGYGYGYGGGYYEDELNSTSSIFSRLKFWK